MTITKEQWNSISCSEFLTEEEIEKCKDQLNWTNLIKRSRPFSYEFLHKYADNINWLLYLEHHLHVINDKFCREFMDYINWSLVSCNCSNLSYEFMREFRSYISWYDVSCHIHNIFDREKYLDFVREFKKELWWEMMSERYFVEDRWKKIRDEFEECHG